MKNILYITVVLASAFLFYSCKSNESLTSELLPQISEAYKVGDWEKVILLTDSLRNNGISYTKYIGWTGVDIPYCEALISTGNANKAIAEIKNHITNINPKDYYAYHTLGVAYCALKDTLKAIEAYNNSLKINPGYARPYIHLDHIYAKTDIANCKDNYSIAIQLLGNRGMFDDVLKLGFESLEVDSINPIILKYMGDACFAKDGLQNAKTLYGRVLGDAAENGSTVPQVFFESDYQLALINYIEGSFQESYTLLDVIYANEKGFPKSPNSIIFCAYILGAAVTHQMNEPIVSNKLMELANEIDSKATKDHYDYFLSIHKH
ncbi:MAG: hypothetical protein NC115_05360 [Bacteroidales bacterium]|nr:hypothetical protein [Bacteroidales bacterium]